MIELVSVISCSIAQESAAFAVIDIVLNREKGKHELHCTHLERVSGGLYSETVNRVGELVQAVLPRDPIAVIDISSVGQPVLQLTRKTLRDCKVLGVVITDSDTEVVENDDWRLPKTSLVTLLQIALESNELKIAAGIPGVATLIKELLNYQNEDKGTPATVNVRALAVACYIARQVIGKRVHPKSSGPGFAFFSGGTGRTGMMWNERKHRF